MALKDPIIQLIEYRDKRQLEVDEVLKNTTAAERWRMMLAIVREESFIRGMTASIKILTTKSNEKANK